MAEYFLSHLSPDLDNFKLLAPRKILWVQFHAGSHGGSLKEDLVPHLVTSPTSLLMLLPRGGGVREEVRVPGRITWRPSVSPSKALPQLLRASGFLLSLQRVFHTITQARNFDPWCQRGPCYANVGK